MCVCVRACMYVCVCVRVCACVCVCAAHACLRRAGALARMYDACARAPCVRASSSWPPAAKPGQPAGPQPAPPAPRPDLRTRIRRAPAGVGWHGMDSDLTRMRCSARASGPGGGMPSHGQITRQDCAFRFRFSPHSKVPRQGMNACHFSGVSEETEASSNLGELEDYARN